MTISDAELVSTACPKINEHAWAFFFDGGTIARGEQLGIDPLTFYVMGRGGVLGDVEWPVVLAAFGYFNPEIVKGSWEKGKEKVSPRIAGRAFVECCQEFGRRRLSEVDGLEAFCEAAGAVNDAADPQGLALYAAAAAEQLASDVAGRAMQLMAVLREYRGSAHLVANVASGVDPKVAHLHRRPEMWAMFGWSDDQKPEVTSDDIKQMAEADALTDAIVTPAYAVLDQPQREALLHGLDGIVAAITTA